MAVLSQAQDVSAMSALTVRKGSMMASQWDTDEAGNVTLSPLLDFVIAPAQLVVIAQLHTGHQTAEPTKPEKRRSQIGMTTEQARRLGQDLCRAADQIDAKGPGTAQ